MFSSNYNHIQPFQIDLLEKICNSKSIQEQENAVDTFNNEELLRICIFLLNDKRRILENALGIYIINLFPLFQYNLISNIIHVKSFPKREIL